MIMNGEENYKIYLSRDKSAELVVDIAIQKT